MNRSLVLVALAAVVMAGSIFARPLQAQVTRADSAAVLLDATRRLQQEGEAAAARELLALIVRHFSGTPAGLEAEDLLSVTDRRNTETSGRASLIAFSTLYGAWLGVAVPAAFGAHEPEPYGAGLLVGAPSGFFVAKAFADRFPMSSGQATLTGFGARWGTWQGIGWREVLDIGTRTEQYCDPDWGCTSWEEDPEEAPFAASIVGGLAGLFTAGYIAQRLAPTHGEASMIELGSMWGSWYGLASAIVSDIDDEEAILTLTLVGSNVGLIASAIATRSWKMGAGRARIISAAGLAGGVAGLGLDLLGDVDDEETAVLLPALGSAIGLIAGSYMTRHYDSGIPAAANRVFEPGLVNFEGARWSFGMPIPQPASIRHQDWRTGTAARFGAKIPILSGRF